MRGTHSFTQTNVEALHICLFTFQKHFGAFPYRPERALALIADFTTLAVWSQRPGTPCDALHLHLYALGEHSGEAQRFAAAACA
jgi:hypothetical protein